MTENDSFDGNGDVKAVDREAQGILGSTALKLRAATARLVSERFVEPVKARIPSEQEVFDGLRKAPGIALKAIDGMWAPPPQEPGARGKPPASTPVRQASAPLPGIESIWGLPPADVAQPDAFMASQDVTPTAAARPRGGASSHTVLELHIYPTASGEPRVDVRQPASPPSMKAPAKRKELTLDDILAPPDDWV